MEAKKSEMESVYMEKRVFDPPKEFVEKGYIKSMEEYEKLHKRSIEDPEGFGVKWLKSTLTGSKNGTGRWKNIVLRTISVYATSPGEN
jgi:hypothetical protein